MAEIFGDSGRLARGKHLVSPPCPSAKQPWSLGCAGSEHWSVMQRPWPVEGCPYRGRSVLLCRVFLAVPSSRGRALCRLDMATVFLRSITA